MSILLATPVSEARDPVALESLAQVAALCWRLRHGKVQVLMVTSRETRRWVIPKGWPMDGLGPECAAEREAWEEAGALGKIDARVLGSYDYGKVMRDGGVMACRVAVYPLRIEALKRRFPERKERRRKWFDAKRAAGLVQEAGLAGLLKDLDKGPGLLLGKGRLGPMAVPMAVPEPGGQDLGAQAPVAQGPVARAPLAQD